MQIEKFRDGSKEVPNKLTKQTSQINVRAIITCPKCSYRKVFRNQFHRTQMELLSAALKVMDWLTCNNCGELLELNLEFEI